MASVRLRILQLVNAPNTIVPYSFFPSIHRTMRFTSLSAVLAMAIVPAVLTSPVLSEQGLGDLTNQHNAIADNCVIEVRAVNVDHTIQTQTSRRGEYRMTSSMFDTDLIFYCKTAPQGDF